MNNKKHFLLVVSLASVLMILSGYTAASGTSNNISVEQVLKASQSWDGASYTSYPSGTPELSILKITIQPHTVLDWHTHPMPNAAYVLSGELVVEKKSGGLKKTIKAGDTLAETVGTNHRGYTEDKPVTLVVFYAGIKDMLLSEK